MNREIKFRGLRDTESGGVEMVCGQVSMDSNQDCIYHKTHPDRIHWRTESGGHASAPVRKGTVGQYIGLKDKNDRDIFEGDVLHEKREKTAPMANNAIERVFTLLDIRNSYTFDPDNCVVVGNIHQHPELLNS